MLIKGAGRGIDVQHIEILENLVQGSLRPDITFLFDLDADIGLSRAQSRGESDRFEQQHIDFFNKVRNQYLKMADSEQGRYRVIHAQFELENVQQQIDKLLRHIL